MIAIPALVDMLIKMTRSWEEERNKVFLYDQVRYLTLSNTLEYLCSKGIEETV